MLRRLFWQNLQAPFLMQCLEGIVGIRDAFTQTYGWIVWDLIAKRRIIQVRREWKGLSNCTNLCAQGKIINEFNSALDRMAGTIQIKDWGALTVL